MWSFLRKIEIFWTFSAAASSLILIIFFGYFKFYIHLVTSDGEESSRGANRPQTGESSTHADVYHVDVYREPKLPKFFREDPVSFFVIAEASFRRAHIRSEPIKADYLIASLDHDLVPHIRHIIETEPKPVDVYT